MNLSKLHFWLLVGFVAGLVVTTIILAISVQYVFFPEKAHYQVGTCQITSCTVSPYTCTKKNRWGQVTSRWNCDTITMSIRLTYDENNYTKYYPNNYYDWYYVGICNSPTIECYYDDSDIGNTLSLSILPPPAGGTSAVVIFTILLAAFVVSMITWTCCYFCNWRYRDDPLTVNVIRC